MKTNKDNYSLIILFAFLVFLIQFVFNFVLAPSFGAHTIGLNQSFMLTVVIFLILATNSEIKK